MTDNTPSTPSGEREEIEALAERLHAAANVGQPWNVEKHVVAAMDLVDAARLLRQLAAPAAPDAPTPGSEVALRGDQDVSRVAGAGQGDAPTPEATVCRHPWIGTEGPGIVCRVCKADVTPGVIEGVPAPATAETTETDVQTGSSRRSSPSTDSGEPQTLGTDVGRESSYARFKRIAVDGAHELCFRAGQHICGAA